LGKVGGISGVQQNKMVVSLAVTATRVSGLVAEDSSNQSLLNNSKDRINFVTEQRCMERTSGL
jgi:hypothetical protein